MPLNFKEIYRVVKLIPRGRVMSYSGVARQCGRPGAQRVVGYALNALRDEDGVPWWRVVNALGRISNSSSADAPERQRQRLRAEQVEVGADHKLDMRIYDAEHEVYQKLRRAAARKKRADASPKLH